MHPFPVPVGRFIRLWVGSACTLPRAANDVLVHRVRNGTLVIHTVCFCAGPIRDLATVKGREARTHADLEQKATSPARGRKRRAEHGRGPWSNFSALRSVRPGHWLSNLLPSLAFPASGCVRKKQSRSQFGKCSYLAFASPMPFGGFLDSWWSGRIIITEGKEAKAPP